MESKVRELFGYSRDFEKINHRLHDFKDNLNEIDLVITLGGDGTLLYASDRYDEKNEIIWQIREIYNPYISHGVF